MSQSFESMFQNLKRVVLSYECIKDFCFIRKTSRTGTQKISKRSKIGHFQFRKLEDFNSRKQKDVKDYFRIIEKIRSSHGAKHYLST